MKCPNCGKEMRSKVRDYEYVESGLKDVVLKNIKVHECKSCSEVLPEIRNVKQVHRWIAEYLLTKRTPLTGEEFRFLRKAMSKSAKELAPLLGVHPVTISRWENNKETIGPQSDRLIRVLFVAGPLLPSVESTRKLLNKVFECFLAIRTAGRKPKPERIIIRPARQHEQAFGAHE
jgi:putative zinc finger/helix-turn-helix YgiT family protein